MLKRHLYLQIYRILLLALFAVLLIFGLIGFAFGPNQDERNIGNTIATLAVLALPEARASQHDQKEGLEHIATKLNLSLTLLDANRKTIAVVGKEQKLPEHFKAGRSWQKRKTRGAWALSMPDGRWLLIDGIKAAPLSPFMRLGLFLIGIALAVGVIAYPFVRRLTRRLEDLKNSVDTIGSGNLKERVAVEGKDEIAVLATSFNAAAEKIEGLLSSQKMLLANASHELRTPLSRIRLGIEMLENNQNTSRVDGLREDIGELDELIDEILLMSRLDTGANVMLENDIDLVAIVAEESAHFQDCHLTGTAPLMTGDRRLLARLIRNLLQNAEIHGATPVHVDLQTHSDHVVLIVKDSGKGFPVGEETRLFEAFQRGGDRQNIAGYGLGLALVRQIVEAHKGSVEILPKSKAQSAIKVTLPV